MIAAYAAIIATVCALHQLQAASCFDQGGTYSGLAGLAAVVQILATRNWQNASRTESPNGVYEP